MSVAPLKRFAILDDYQGVALSLGPWDKLPKSVEITVFRDTITDHAALVERLKPFDAILAMRERTPFPRKLIEALPNLRLIITTGGRNRSIDAAACAERGVVFCGTGTSGDPTADLTWGLILSLVRDIPRQQEALRAGRWPALPLARWMPVLLLGWALVAVVGAPESRTHGLVTKLALAISGRPQPYQRSDLHRDHRRQPAQSVASLQAG